MKTCEMIVHQSSMVPFLFSFRSVNHFSLFSPLNKMCCDIIQ